MTELIIRRFPAPWGVTLIVMSALASLLCATAGVMGGWALFRTGQIGLGSALCALLLATIIGSALFTIRGYTPLPGVLLVHRLFWPTRVSLAGLQSVSYQPTAMRSSIRTFGNGGLFSFSGRYWSRRLGSYRAFVTDLKQTVVLGFPHKTVVVSPACPQQFVCELWKAQGDQNKHG